MLPDSMEKADFRRKALSPLKTGRGHLGAPIYVARD